MRIDDDSRQQHKTIFTVHHHQYSFIPITIFDRRGKRRENGTWHTNANHWRTLAIHLFVLKLIVQFEFSISIFISLIQRPKGLFDFYHEKKSDGNCFSAINCDEKQKKQKTTHRTCVCRWMHVLVKSSAEMSFSKSSRRALHSGTSKRSVCAQPRRCRPRPIRI